MRTTLFVALFTVALLAYGCSDDDSSPTTPGGGAATTIEIGGTLQAATAPLSSTHGRGKVSAAMAIADYKIVAQALNTKHIYVVTSDAQGAFSFTVPAGDSYTFHILDDNYFYVGPLILAEYDGDADEVPEGLEAGVVDIEMDTVIVSEDENVAVLANGDVVTIDETMVVDAVNGIPAGAADQGEGVSSGSGSALDLDGDGVINIMDSDDDGDGILDEFDNDHVAEASCSVVDNINLSSNFRNNLDAVGNLSTSLSDGQYTIMTEAIVTAGQEGKITSVHVYGPSYQDDLIITPEDVHYGDGEYWPTYNDKCLLENYFSGGSGERWGAFINGSDNAHVWEVVQPGDVWVYEITYNSGDNEYTELMAKKINFVFVETPANVTVNGADWTSQAMYELPDTVVIRWSTLADLPGMNYGVAFFPWVDGQQFTSESGTIQMGVDADSALFILEDTTTTGETIDWYSIDVVASDSYGDNASTMGGSISKWPAE